jgi:hypothetical protein
MQVEAWTAYVYNVDCIYNCNSWQMIGKSASLNGRVGLYILPLTVYITVM